MTEHAGPEQMRSAMADYVQAVHGAYIDAANALPPGDRARLPLFTADTFTVIVAGARYLHVLATTDKLPAPSGPEVSLEQQLDDMHWTLRFFDPVVSPGLGLIDETREPAPQAVRETLGIRSVIYHLSVPPGSGLSAHHAQHAGTGLAHSQAAADRDFTTIAQLRPRDGSLVSEMYQAHVNAMPNAARLLAGALTGTIVAADDVDDLDLIRRNTLAILRSTEQ
ncbi:MAG: hypothetical protein ISP31_06515 [Candidatus Nanopelagicales bacterium]|nr:hypothetical protein [Candidatus Nanopelagicales bacterium]